MKKIYTLAAIAAGFMAFASCSSDSDSIIEESKTVNLTLGVNAADDMESTRTYTDITNLSASNTSTGVNWTGDEHISVFAEGSTTNSDFRLVNINPDSYNMAYFTGSTTQAGQYEIVYPYNAKNSYNPSTKYVTITIPHQQTAVKNSFDPAAAFQAGTAKITELTNNRVDLMNVCAFLRIKLPAGWKKVTVSPFDANSTFALVGEVEVDARSGGASIKVWNESKKQKTVTLEPKSGTPAEAGDYLIAIAPSTGYPELKVTAELANNKTYTSKTMVKDINAAYVYNLGDLSNMQ